MQEHKSHHPTRWRYLERIWQDLARNSELPQLDRWLAQNFRNYPQFGKRDRLWYSDQIFAAMRSLPFATVFLQAREHGDLSWSKLVACATATTSPKSLWQTATSLSSDELLRTALCHQRLVAAARSPSLPPPPVEPLGVDDRTQHELAETVHLVLAELEQGPASGPEHLAALCLRHAVPPWYAPHLSERCQRTPTFAVDSWLGLLGLRPPLWLRLNAKAQEQAIAKDVAAMGGELKAEDGRLMLVKLEHKQINQLLKDHAGALELQDYASQALGQAVQAGPGMLVYDVCAGGGGKTLQLASAMQHQGMIWASDVRPWKLKELELRVKQAGFGNIITGSSENLLQHLPNQVKKRGGYDRILVDAPCSGSGTWRRSPDTKLRLDADELTALSTLQLDLLRRARKQLRPDGLLIYGTCSFLVAENEAVVQTLLAEDPSLKLVAEQLVGAPTVDSDTMYFAVLGSAAR